jgi:hypothetical protein
MIVPVQVSSEIRIIKTQKVKSMLKAIQQEVTIQPGGIITLHSPELQSGLRANVIVILTENSHLSQEPNEVIQKTEVQPTLSELLENVAAEKERMTLTYRKKLFLAVVPIEDVEVIKQLEHHLDDYTNNQLKRFQVDDALGEFLNTAENANFVVTYQKKVFLAVVPIEDVYLIEELEECIDHADANDAFHEALNTGTISSEQLDKELGW